MPPDISGGASVCVRDIGRGFPFPSSVASVNRTSTPAIPISRTSSSSSVSAPSTLLSSSVESNTTATSIESVSPPAYSSLYPPSPPATNEPKGDVLNQVNLAALENGITHLALATPTPRPTSSASSISLPSETSSLCSDELNDLVTLILPNLPTNGKFTVSPLPKEVKAAHPDWETWEGFVLDDEEKDERVLYVKSKKEDGVNVRENVMALLECADEGLESDMVVFCLEKTNPDLASILHSLLYVGGSIVHPADGDVERKHNSDYVLVGLDL